MGIGLWLGHREPLARRSNRDEAQRLALGAWSLGVAACFCLAACGQTDDGKDNTDGAVAGDAGADGADGGGHPTLPAVDPNPDCEELEPRHCTLPWPPPKFLIDDKATATGKRLQFGAKTLPANADGKHIDPKAWNRSDGFGVGAPILTLWPGIDLKGLPGELDLQPSLAADARIGLWQVDAAGKAERLPFWVELDIDADAKSPTELVLILRPAVLLRAGMRHIVAFRGLKDATGALFPASEAFAALRDGKTAGTYLAPRQAGFDTVFSALEAEGWKRADLQLAWAFMTSSDSFLHSDMLAIRDAALAATAKGGAELKVTQLKENKPEQDPEIWLDIEGTFRAPLFTEPFEMGKGAGGKVQFGHRIARDAAGKPKQNGWVEQPFWLRLPHAARDGKKVGLLQYGHGLLGTGSQAKAGHTARFAQEHSLAIFASNWTGMANPDYQPITAMIFDFSHFLMLPERVHQGIAEFLVLARSMRDHLAALPELKARGVAIDGSRLFYTGDSQGGIYGTTYIALSEDVTRAVLGVPGNNYASLLRRSVDFVPYFLLMRANYPGIIDRTVLISGGQVLWDQVDPVSYLRHLSAEPFPKTPKHVGIFAQAQGDWQVATVTNEIAVRSGIGIALAPHYGRPVSLLKEATYPIAGSALVNWDFGNPWPVPGPLPPYDDVGDPHGKPRGNKNFLTQMAHFFATGEVIDTCGGKTCPGDGK